MSKAPPPPYPPPTEVPTLGYPSPPPAKPKPTSETTADDWRPIDTAPKDGTEVRVIVEAIASWQKGVPSILMAPGWKLDLPTAKALRWRSQ